MIKTSLLVLITLFVLSGCEDKKESDRNDSRLGMKCGSGKCGGGALDGNAALAKKKKNILSQMREEDKRKECVMQAKTVKSVYDCVRDPKTGRLSTDNRAKPTMKCATGKCGSPK